MEANVLSLLSDSPVTLYSLQKASASPRRPSPWP